MEILYKGMELWSILHMIANLFYYVINRIFNSGKTSYPIFYLCNIKQLLAWDWFPNDS